MMTCAPTRVARLTFGVDLARLGVVRRAAVPPLDVLVLQDGIGVGEVVGHGGMVLLGRRGLGLGGGHCGGDMGVRRVSFSKRLGWLAGRVKVSEEGTEEGGAEEWGAVLEGRLG